MERTRVLIMGTAGRDHNFNIYFRNNSQYEMVAFTAAQTPDIEGRVYPPELAGELSPEGIPIYAEDELDARIRDQKLTGNLRKKGSISCELIVYSVRRLSTR